MNALYVCTHPLKITPSRPMKIALNLIMKNEAKVLPRLLESIWPILDYYVVIDTGSTDDSKKIVKDFFDSKNIQGEIFDYEHKADDIGYLTFDDWRNYALEKSQGKADYGFWVDCDEQLRMPNGTAPEHVTKLKQFLSKYDSVSVQTFYNSSQYTRMNFFRLSLPWKWISPVHEVLVCDKQARPGYMDQKMANVLVTPDGHSWTSEKEQQKYERHALSFHRYIDKNGMEPRAVFYLAQSYKDQDTDQSREMAIEWYRERVKLTTGFFEERYVSQIRIGELMDKLNRPTGDIIYEYLQCAELDSEKADNWVKIIEKLQKDLNWNAAYMFSSHAMKFHEKNPFPNRSLFIDNYIYDHRILTLHRLNCIRLNKIVEIVPYLNLEQVYNNAANTASDFNEHMPTLRKYAEKVSSITEIQARWNVVSTYAFFLKKPHFINVYDYNKTDDIESLSAYAKKANVKFNHYFGSEITKPIEPTGLLLLDSIHDYDHVLGELKLHAPQVKRYILIHDTVVFGKENSNDKKSPKQGIQGAIEEFLATNEEWNMIEIHLNNHGLAVLERGKWKDNRVTKFPVIEPKTEIINPIPLLTNNEPDNVPTFGGIKDVI